MHSISCGVWRIAGALHLWATWASITAETLADDAIQEAYLGLERISPRIRDRLKIPLFYGTTFHAQQCAEKYLRDDRGEPYYGESTFE